MSENNIVVKKINLLSGPNIWGKSKATQAIISVENSMGDGDLKRIEHISGIVLGNHHTDYAQSLKALATRMQEHIGMDAALSLIRPIAGTNLFHVVITGEEPRAGEMIVELAIKVINNETDKSEFISSLSGIKKFYQNLRFGPSTRSIVNAATARGIPHIRLNDKSIVQLGWGVRRKIISESETSDISDVVVSIAQDKTLTKKLLANAFLLVPDGAIVRTFEQALQQAENIGFPVVIKPNDMNQGKGITVDIKNQDQLLAAFNIAKGFGTEIMVEKHFAGFDYRLLIINNKLAAAARRDPPCVIGDGSLTVKGLVEILNQNPDRGDDHESVLTKVPIDEVMQECLREQNITLDFVPAKGQIVRLRNSANLSTGGTAEDVTDFVHPQIISDAVLAAQVIGDNLWGIDVVCQDITKPLNLEINGGTNGAIIEVNSSPGLRMHTNPTKGKPRPEIGERIVETMFGASADEEAEAEFGADNYKIKGLRPGRIPIFSITGTNGKTTTTSLIAYIMQKMGHRVGMTNTNGIYINGLPIDKLDASGPQSAQRVLAHPEVEVAVLETARRGILFNGLGFDYCDVGIVTNIGAGDHLGMNAKMGFINTAEGMAEVKQVVVQNIQPKGFAVLNADDPLVVKMAEFCAGQIVWFSCDINNILVNDHIKKGGCGLFLEGDNLNCHWLDKNINYSVPFEQLGLFKNFTPKFQLQNIMAAMGAVLAAHNIYDFGYSHENLLQGILTAMEEFNSANDLAIGRFNVFNYKDAIVIADYGHNFDAINAVCETFDGWRSQNKTIVASAPGDRRDEDIFKFASRIGNSFNRAILFELEDKRGRTPGETIPIITSALQDSGNVKAIQVAKDEIDAINIALSSVQKGDLCVLLVDEVESSINHIKKILKTSTRGKAPLSALGEAF